LTGVGIKDASVGFQPVDPGIHDHVQQQQIHGPRAT
jgi:hypothetical protein